MVNAHLEPGYGDFIASKWDPAPASTPSLNVSNLFISVPPTKGTKNKQKQKSNKKYPHIEFKDKSRTKKHKKVPKTIKA